MKYDYDLLIIGGGSGGLSLASGAAQLGVKVLLVDKALLGGDCLHYGCVPSKSLIKSGKIAQYTREADHYGLKALEPKLDWKDITERITGIQDKIQEHDSAKRFRALGCDVVFGTAKFVDDHEVEIELNHSISEQLENLGTWKLGNKKSIKVSSKKIVIATGSRPNVPPIEGLKEVGFITNETVFSMEKQPKSMLIIGGGVIAVEIAQAFQRLGTQVTIAIRGEHLLDREDQEVIEVIENRLKKEGVEILNKVTFEKFELNSGVNSAAPQKVLHYTKDGKDEVQSFDTVLVATGRKANLELDLEKAGVKYDRVIPVDKKCRTNRKHILAIGDVNGQVPFTHGANYEAGAVLTNEILHVPSKVNDSSIGYTVFTDPEIASIGLNEKRAQEQGVWVKVIESRFASQDRALAEGENDGLIRILIDKKDRIMGCQIASPRAGEMIREWQLAISQKIKLSKLARSTFIYPTFGEMSKWAAGSHYAPKLFAPKVKKILQFLFRYRGKS